MSTRTYSPAPATCYPLHLAALIQTATGLATPPQVDIAFLKVSVTHANLTAAMDSAIQGAITAYVYDPTWNEVPAMRNDAILRQRGLQALTTNATYLAIASPTAAQVATQSKALTRQVDGVIRLLLGVTDSVADS